MEQCQFSIIIPAPEYKPEWPVLLSLKNECPWPDEKYEIILAIGKNPSRQRNLAIQKAKGQFLIFLDSDSMVDSHYFKHLDKTIADLEFDVLGGPVLLPSQSSPRQELFQALLSNSRIVGPAAARYLQQGIIRFSDERELILCNLVIRADLFSKFGLFLENLYPNEENEWLDRVLPYARIYYDPDLAIKREQCKTIGEFFSTLIRYGRGRTQQALTSRKWNLKNIFPVFLFLILLGFFKYPLAMLTFFLSAVWIYFFSLIANQSSSVRGFQRFFFGLMGLSVFFFYMIGQCAGFISRPKRSSEPAAVDLLNAQGKALP